jgi:hypothetical protein
MTNKASEMLNNANQMKNSDKNNSCVKEGNSYKYTKNSVTIENKHVI